jgi:hypothetical protein
MKRYIFTLSVIFGLLCSSAWAQFPTPVPMWKPTDTRGDAGRILDQVYGGLKTACTQDIDADTGGHNRLGPFTLNRKYVVYCHDGAGAGVACECLQGSSSVDTSAAIGMLLGPGEKVVMTFLPANLYLSCVPFVNNQFIDVCPLDF